MRGNPRVPSHAHPPSLRCMEALGTKSQPGLPGCPCDASTFMRGNQGSLSCSPSLLAVHGGAGDKVTAGLARLPMRRQHIYEREPRFPLMLTLPPRDAWRRWRQSHSRGEPGCPRSASTFMRGNQGSLSCSPSLLATHGGTGDKVTAGASPAGHAALAVVHEMRDATCIAARGARRIPFRWWPVATMRLRAPTASTMGRPSRVTGRKPAHTR
jgi:hypothetical protein